MKSRGTFWMVLFAGLALLTFTACGSSPASKVPPPPPHPNQWTWATGSDITNQAGTYGTQGESAPGNTPGARAWPSAWTDASGNFWLFGGYGFDTSSTTGGGHGGDLNDLWKYSGGEWAWISGANAVEQPGTYGTEGVPSPTNLPGGRYQAVSWTDPAGNLWLFGGLGLDSVGTRGQLNDLWRYSNAQWTWMSGSNLANEPGTPANQPGVYGTIGTPAPGNVPGARVDAAAWADSSGNLWLFGGLGVDSNGSLGILNDLWRYSGGEWAWMSGSNLVNQFGVYGTMGTPAPTNVPGARTNPVTWVDGQGNLWLLGGEGNDLNGSLCQQTFVCELNDLWKYSNGEWTWVGGSNVVDQYGIYGAEGMPAPTNFPGARDSATARVDAAGNVWLFGGFGFDSTVGPPEVFGDLNDLWKYSNGEWTWVSGSNFAEQAGVYGTQGMPASANAPGARMGAVSWTDPSGNFWLFGGMAIFMPYSPKFNDLWEYQP